MVRRRQHRPLCGRTPRLERRRRLNAARLCRVAFTAALACIPSACDRGPPNIVLITVDTLRADRLGHNGHDNATSPFMDRIAATGVVFSDASTTIPRTTQAVASLFTSRHPSEHGVREIGERMADHEVTLAEILRDAGYSTVGVSANPVAGVEQGLDQGFDVFVAREELDRRYGLRHNLAGPNPAGMGPAEAVSIEALRQLDGLDAPFFLWLLYMDPHWPYNPPAPHNQVVDWASFDFYRELRSFKPARPTLYFNLNGRSTDELPRVSSLYDAEIRYTDQMIGQMLKSVVSRRMAAGTMLVITSDHGESLGEHGYYFQHGALAYQPTMRIPLIFKFPGKVPEGRRISTPVSILDVAPTVLAQLGVDSPDTGRFSGTDLSPLWGPEARRGSAAAKRSILGESGTEVYPTNPLREIGGRMSSGLRFARDRRWVIVERDGDTTLHDVAADPELSIDLSSIESKRAAGMAEHLKTIQGDGRWHSLREGRWKLLRIPTYAGTRWELYDLESDPLETADVVEEQPEIAAAMRSRLEVAVAAFGTGPEPQPPVSEEVRSQLEALGYGGG